MLAPARDGVLMLFAHFKALELAKDESLAAAEIDARFSDYQRAFIEKLTAQFFNNNKTQEWFSERFNPHFRMVEEGKQHSVSMAESLMFTDSFSEDVANSTASCRADLTALKVNPEDSPFGGVYVGRHCSGHQINTVHVAHIPAACTRVDVKDAITNVLVKRLDLRPDHIVRVLVSQPKLTKLMTKDRHASSAFLREAWVVLETGVSVHSVVSVLHGTSIMPSAYDDNSEASYVDVSRHRPGETQKLKHSMSNIYRIGFDLRVATQLAGLLDVERKIPTSAALAATLELIADKSTVDRLDVAVAYLRRVHYVSFYAGQRFDNEADLLASNIGTFVRNKKVLDKGAVSAVSKRDGVVAPEGDSVPETKDGDGEGGEGKDDDDDDDDKEKTAPLPPADFNSMTNAEYLKWCTENKLEFPTLDEWIMKEIKILVARADVRANVSKVGAVVQGMASWASPASIAELQRYAADLKDAAAVHVGSNDAVGRWRASNSRIEEGGKARCLKCDKLFMDQEYLSKHFGLKHVGDTLAVQVGVAEPHLLDRMRQCPLDELPFPMVDVETKTTEDRKQTMAETVKRFVTNKYGNKAVEMEDDTEQDEQTGAKEAEGEVLENQRQTGGKRAREDSVVDDDVVIDREVKRGNYFDVDAPKVRFIALCSLPPFFCTVHATPLPAPPTCRCSYVPSTNSQGVRIN
jgi:hypothetical protein